MNGLLRRLDEFLDLAFEQQPMLVDFTKTFGEFEVGLHRLVEQRVVLFGRGRRVEVDEAGGQVQSRSASESTSLARIGARVAPDTSRNS